MNRTWNRIAAVGMCLGLAACGGTGSDPEMNPDGGTTPDGGTSGSGTCTLTADTTETSTVSPSGCHVLTRDTHACEADRKAQGLSGFWLQFSCRVSLSSTETNGLKMVQARADGQPDYKSFYFATANACYETYSGSIHNPNSIAAQSYTIDFPAVQDTTTQSMRGAIVGLALNGVPIFGNFAAPGDDIYTEAKTFDRCGAHPQNTGVYHYHSEPYSLSYDDARFIGVMRDGYPIYGRRDTDGGTPTLDQAGGHTGVTADSPETPVYHYHVNEQTSTSSGTKGQKQWFLTTGTYRGSPGGCVGCN